MSIFFCIEGQAQSSTQQTQSKLKQLNNQINNLQKILHSAHDKQGTFHKKLAETEKQIGEGVQHLNSLQRDIDFKQTKINNLHEQINQLTQQLTTQQHLLANHIRARYQIGEYQPFKWLINQDDPNKISRILTYYEYIIKSRQSLITQIKKTKVELNDNKENLKNELIDNNRLKTSLVIHQQELQKNKNVQKTLIQSLNEEIQDKQNILHEVKKNKENLANLLKSLPLQSVTQTSKPFSQMIKKLPFPVQAQPGLLKKMHQGVTFFAEEGAAVTAIYPGKVVFSDWLKGYGLLLIIDHGNGFMSLYAHNESLFKSKGQYVRQNEQIASVGHTGGIKENGLYFEIRVKGKAIPPLNWFS